MCGSTLSLILFYREKKMQRMIKDIKFTRWSEVKAAQSCPTLKSLSHVPPLTIQSMELFRPEYWDGQPLPSSGDLPNSGIEPRSPALQVYSLPAEPPGKPQSMGDVAILSHHGILSSVESFPFLEPDWACTWSKRSNAPAKCSRFIPGRERPRRTPWLPTWP